MVAKGKAISRSPGISRRRFLRNAALGAAWVAGPSLIGCGEGDVPSPRSSRASGASGRETVAVFGGGIAGLTAAHELAERGFDVTIYERRAWGGKARSTEVPSTGTGGRRDLPGEHGFRIFFGFYQNTIETFRRIPFESNPNGVFDNLVPAPQLVGAREGKRELVLPLGQVDPRPYTPAQIFDVVAGTFVERSFPAEDLARFAARFIVFLSSCDARRLGQWEHVRWTDFTQADRCSEDFRRVWIKSWSEVVQASKAGNTSASFPGCMLELGLYSLLGRGANGATFRIMDRPTNEALFDPWVALLERLGVRMLEGHDLIGLDVRDGRIAGARVAGPHGATDVIADWYVCALPVERARRLWDTDILAAEPSLVGMDRLSTDWMNGLKLFLREERPLFRGPISYADSPWTVSSVSQAQFWGKDFASTYGDGEVRESLSVIISNWNEPGFLFGKPARECTEEEIIAEVWEQMKRHLNDGDEMRLTDDLIHSWDIDPGMVREGGRLVSDDPLVLPAVGELEHRPDVVTAIPNLMLAGDYLRSPWQVANMETASYNARRAVNAILDAAGSHETPAATIEPYRPPEWEPLKKIDEERWRLGLPNLFDVELPAVDLRGLLETLA